MLFTMPYGQTMEIRPSRELTLDENLEIGQDEEIEGLTWHIYIGKIELPWFCTTKMQATAIALGCQYGARHYMNMQ